jgi:hypothetical protein
MIKLVGALARTVGPAVLLAALLTGMGTAAAGAAVTASSSGSAEEVPGLGTLNSGGNAETVAMYCEIRGDCGAGGYYTQHSGQREAFVVNEVDGKWGKALEVPGLAALNKGGNAQVSSVSCWGAGGCAAVGFYTDSSHQRQAFGVLELSGTWQHAVQLAGTAAVSSAGHAQADSVSCTYKGACEAAGSFDTGAAGAVTEGFVVRKNGNAWGTAQVPPGLAALNAGGNASVLSVYCALPGDCSAGGSYQASGSGHPVEAFVADEVSGTWAKAEELPGTAKLNAGLDAQVSSVACWASGQCAAGGFYSASVGGKPEQRAFVVNQLGGTWYGAEAVPAPAAASKAVASATVSVSCQPLGPCSAGGYYQFAKSDSAFVIRGAARADWKTAVLVVNGGAEANSVSCNEGTCAAVGPGGAFPRSDATFEVSQSGITWQKGEPVPGLAALNAGKAATVQAVSCAPVGDCAAGGSYTDKAGHIQAFVTT